MALTRELIVASLAESGIGPGDTVLFHSSLRSMGHVHGGADTVIDAFIQAVGPEGTVVVPTIIHTSGLPRPPFDPDSSPSEVGLITETLRRRSGAYRSSSPTHSVAAIGARADELTRGHAQASGPWTPWGIHAFGDGSPWDLLYRWNAKCYLLGVPFTVCTLFHYAQTLYIAKHHRAFAQAIPFPYFSHEAMGELLKARHRLTPHSIGPAECWWLHARALVDTTLETMESNPDALRDHGQDVPFTRWIQSRPPADSQALTGAMACSALNIEGFPVTREGTSLAARALYLKSRNSELVIVSLTLLFLTVEQARAIRGRIEAECGVSADAVMLACTHVHSGLPHDSVTDPVLDKIGRAVIAAIRKAQQQLQPVRLASGVHQVPSLTRLRRGVMNDGRAHTVRRAVPSTWRCETKPEYVRWDGVLDTDLTVLRVEDLDRKPIGCLFHFTTHPLPDLHGSTADWIERAMGDDFVCLPLNGAMGDVDLKFDEAVNGQFAGDQLTGMTHVLGGNVIELLGRSEAVDDTLIRVVCDTVDLPADPWVIEHRTDDAIPWIQSAARDGTFRAPLLAAKVGPLTLVGIPGELSSSMGLHVKAAIKQTASCVVGLANGEVGYLLARESRKLGGYESDPSAWALTQSGACEKVVEAMVRIAKQTGAMAD